MTKTKKRIPLSTIVASLGGGGLYIELKKSRIGAAMVLGGVMRIEELTDTTVAALSHSGRVIISGERLTVSTLEKRTLAVHGRITGVTLSYGKA